MILIYVTGRRYLAILVIAGVFFLAGCRQEGGQSGKATSQAGTEGKEFNRDILAYVNDTKLTLEDLRQVLATDSAEKHKLAVSQSVEGFLIDYLNRRAVETMYYLEAQKEGVSPPDLEEKMWLDRMFLTKFEYLRHIGKDISASEYDVKDKLPARWERVKLQELIVADESQAEASLERIGKGEPFETLVAELSIGPAAHKLGVLSYIWPYPFNNIFSEMQSDVVFDMKVGEVSPIIKTPFGYGIYKLLERDVLSEGEVKIAISSFVREEREKRVFKELESIFSRHEIWNMDRKTKPVEFFTLYENWYLKNVPEDDSEKTVVARVDDIEIRFKDVIYAESMIPRPTRDMAKIDLFARYQEVLDKLIKSAVMAREAEDKGFELSEYSKIDLRLRKEELTVNYYLTSLFEERVDLSDRAVEDFYRSRAGKYSPGRSVALEYLFVKEGDRTDKVYKMISEGESFLSVAEKMSDGLPLGGGPDLGFVNEGDTDEGIREKVFDLSIGEISRPISFKDGFLIVRVYDRKNVKVNDFENVKSLVRRDYEIEMKNRFGRELYSEIKKNYTFAINEKDKGYFIEELEKSRKRLGSEEKLKRGIHH